MLKRNLKCNLRFKDTQKVATNPYERRSMYNEFDRIKRHYKKINFVPSALIFENYKKNNMSLKYESCKIENKTLTIYPNKDFES